MIALAVATLLTITALAIWAAKTIRRPVDWEGPLTKPHTATLAYAYEQILEAADQLAAAFGSTDWIRYAGAICRAINAEPIPYERSLNPFPGLPTIPAFVLRPDYAANAETLHERHGHAVTRALRASERDDRRREGQ